MALLFLRHYPVDLLLAHIFQVPKMNANRARWPGLEFLYAHLRPLLGKYLHVRKSQGTPFFGTLITFILDGSEQPVRSSGDATIDFRFYSVKKKQHSINILVVMSMNMKIIYLSPSYPSFKNDIVIARENRSEWYDTYDRDEWGLGDSGFSGLAADGCNIFASPNIHQPIFKLHASLRVRVENALAHIKQFSATRAKLRIPPKKEQKLLKLHNMCWTIAAVFVNEFHRF